MLQKTSVLMFTGISFCRISALLVFPHERVQMFLKASLHRFTWSQVLTEGAKLKGSSWGWREEGSWEELFRLRQHSRSLGASFTFLREWALAGTEARDALVCLQFLKMQISLLPYLQMFCLSHWSPRIVVPTQFQLMSVFKYEVTKICLSARDAGELAIGLVGPRKKEDLIWLQASKMNSWL